MLGEALLSASVHGRFAFLPSGDIMSLPESLPTNNFINPRVLWCGGVGIPSNGNARDSTVDANRIDLLRCLLAAFSQPLFGVNALGPNKFVNAILDQPNPVNVTFCSSLLNTVFSYDPSGSLPYTSYWTDTQEEIVDLSIQVPCSTPSAAHCWHVD